MESPPRKGASRIADIPPDVLAALNRGELETITLVEWLAVDWPTLLRHALEDVGAGELLPRFLTRVEELSHLKITKRQRALGALLAAEAPELFERFATHRSDTVRSWAAFMLAADDGLDLARRLEATRRFAADRHMGVREVAWDTFRPYVAAELDRGLELLAAWVRDPDDRIRRCAVEGTRPRGVWTRHIEELKREPERAEPLLEPVRSDASAYVRQAVANWINDASKSRPDWARALAERWLVESPTRETAWIVERGLRTLRKGEVRRS